LKQILSLLLCAALLPAAAQAEEDDWGFFISTTYGPRTIDGTTPFGFPAVNYLKRFGKFSLTVAAQAVSIAIDNSSMKYSNLNLMGGYLFFKKKWYSEVVFGYRRVGFDFHYDVADGISDTNVTLTGPYVGLVGGF
jgi:hypothetical protein